MAEKNKSVEEKQQQGEIEKESKQDLDFFLSNEGEPKNKKKKKTFFRYYI